MIEELLKKKWSAINVDAKAKRKLYDYFRQTTSQEICCDNVLEQEFLKLKRKHRKMKKTHAPKSNYLLKENAVIWLDSKGIHVTNANLTDELAKEILEDPRRAKHFEVLSDSHAHLIQKDADSVIAKAVENEFPESEALEIVEEGKTKSFKAPKSKIGKKKNR